MFSLRSSLNLSNTSCFQKPRSVQQVCSIGMFQNCSSCHANVEDYQRQIKILNSLLDLFFGKCNFFCLLCKSSPSALPRVLPSTSFDRQPILQTWPQPAATSHDNNNNIGKSTSNNPRFNTLVSANVVLVHVVFNFLASRKKEHLLNYEMDQTQRRRCKHYVCIIVLKILQEPPQMTDLYRGCLRRKAINH